MKISILGSGAFGIAIATTLVKNNNDVHLWSHTDLQCQELLQRQKNNDTIDCEIKLTSNLDCVFGSEIVIIATPSFAVFETCLKIKDLIDENTIIVTLAKGIIHHEGEYLVFSQLISKVLGEKQPVVALTGPSHAEEVLIGRPTAIVAASENIEAAKTLQNVAMNDGFRVYTATDILGAQLGGALKNVIAIAAGLSYGMGFGDNTTAALITRGFTEISRLGIKMGAKRETFTGLSGIGDLIVTCMSKHSRNRSAGELIGQGVSVNDAMNQIGAVVEGYYATKFGFELSKLHNIEMPIVSAVYGVLYDGLCPEATFQGLMNRSGKDEIDDINMF